MFAIVGNDPTLMRGVLQVKRKGSFMDSFSATIHDEKDFVWNDFALLAIAEI